MVEDRVDCYRSWATAPRDRSWKAPLSTQYTMAESADVHPTAGRRRREKGPPSGLALPRLERVSDTECEHSDDSAGEKEAKRQRSEPSTPVSTPRRLPYEYDALMGITKVGTKEAEGFDEDLDSTEYHDANDTTDDPTLKEETECIVPQQRSMGFQRGYGSSSLKECIELLNAAVESTPAPLDSGVGRKSTDPPHFGHFLPQIGPSSTYRFEPFFWGTPLKRAFWSIFWAGIRVEKISDFGPIHLQLLGVKNG